MTRPKTIPERVHDGEVTMEDVGLAAFPHCDARVLHPPEECEYCGSEDAKVLREDRERLGVNYTGRKDRPWPCPAERARSMASLNLWDGNRPRTHA